MAGNLGRRTLAARRSIPGAAAILLGLLAYLLWGGGHAFSPTRINWIMAGFDTPSHYLGWQFFRHAPWAQWPLGYSPDYGSDAPGTIVLTDSIPLFAFFFKLFNALLPPDFQYIGLWLLCCFELQAWFGYQLMGRMTVDPLLRLLGCAMFLAAPIFLMRLYLHPALAGQWILLAALYLALDGTVRARAWTLLLVVATLVHAYLLVMAGAIWLLVMFGKMVHGAERRWHIGVHVMLVLALVSLAMWAAGYFLPSAVAPAQFTSHTNLLVFLINGPCEFSAWSRLGPCISTSLDAQQKTGDGFGYFGLGFLLLVPLAIALRLYRRRVVDQRLPALTLMPLLMACLALLAFAIGSSIYVGSYLLFSFDMPDPLNRLWTTFRGAARMEWPLWYLVLALCLGVVATRLRRGQAAMVLLLLLVVQYADLSLIIGGMNAEVAKARPFRDQLKTPIWSALALRYRHLAYIPTPSVSLYLLTWIPIYRQLAHYAALNGMSINVGYLARMDLSRLHAASDRRAALLGQGRAEPSTFYAVEDTALWSSVVCAPDHGQWHGLIDGLPVLIPDPRGIPGLSPSLPCPTSRMAPKG